MEWIIISKKYGKQVMLLDIEDYLRFQHLKVYVWTTPRHHTLYARCSVDKKDQRFHRLIMNVTDPLVLVDHINGNGLDNRKANLRLTDSLGNNANSRKRKNSTSKYKGVHLVAGKWKAQIQQNKIKVALGTFNSEIEAAKAYNEACVLLHKSYAKLNSIKEE